MDIKDFDEIRIGNNVKVESRNIFGDTEITEGYVSAIPINEYDCILSIINDNNQQIVYHYEKVIKIERIYNEYLKTQFIALNFKRMIAYNGQFIRKRFQYFYTGNYKKNYCRVTITYQCINKTFLEAREIINQEERKKPIGEQIKDILKNSQDLIQFSFVILIPIKNNKIDTKNLTKAKTRIRKKITKFKKIGKII